MKRFLFAAALVALFASVGAAEEKPVAVATTPVTAASPVMVTSVPMVESVPAQSTRRGLFGRLRNRNSGTTMPAAPAMTMTAATPMPVMSAPAPMLMPGTKTGAMAMPEVPSGIIVVGGTTAVEGTVTPAAYTEPTTTTRRGLFGRLRNR